ncbi:hypothetical protein D9758_010792 [Tetrapyrgos nigripes]|uniref:Uncharacterized protein n=1 Tax=Tetrapyrgos nigripes TaxID=182062 RepID=A0A8H5FZI4_9AGAR|nr:hypothetical protein D9758_010792 [Tetrapyrgos nigripes]
MSQPSGSFNPSSRPPLSPIKSVQNQPVNNIRFTPILTRVNSPFVFHGNENASPFDQGTLSYINASNKRRKQDVPKQDIRDVEVSPVFGSFQGFETPSRPAQKFTHTNSNTTFTMPNETFISTSRSKRKLDGTIIPPCSRPPSTHSNSTTPAIPTLPDSVDQDSPLESRLYHVLEIAWKLGLPFDLLVFEVFRTPMDLEKETWGPEERRFFRSRAAIVSRFF